MPTRIVLVEDHRIVREGLRVLLQNEGFEVVGEAGSGAAVFPLLEEHAPDLILMDIRMPDLNGIDATKRIVSEFPGVRVIALSACFDERSTLDMFHAGALGFVLKSSAFENLADAIRSVMGGHLYLSPSLSESMLKGLVQRPSGGSVAQIDRLSTREREVLQLLSEGRSSKQIGLLLKVSVKTAETHRRNVMEKLQMDSVAELTKFAVREGLTSL